jgi:threonine synthase
MTGKSLSIALETAHPAKFPLELRQILNIEPHLPDSLSGLETRPEDFVCMENNYGLLKDFILKFLK